MSLRLQLLLVSLAVLILPFAGFQFTREIEQILRDAEERAMIATAMSMAAELAPFYPEKTQLPALYVRKIAYPPVIDGYDDDWLLWQPWAQQFGPENTTPVTVLLASDDDYIYMLLQVEDSSRNYASPTAEDNQADRIAIQSGQNRFVIQTSAPGVFEAAPVNGQGAARLRGVWRETTSGYRVELRLPAWSVGERLGFVVWDGSAARQPLAASGAAINAATSLLVRTSAVLTSSLQRINNGRNEKIWLVNSAGWVLAVEGSIYQSGNAATVDKSGFAAWIYRRFLRPDLSATRQRSTMTVRLNAPEVLAALQNRSAVRWYPSPANETMIASAAVPVKVDGTLAGALVLERTPRTLLLFTNQAMVRLIGATLLVFGTVALLLLAFASVISWRVVKLRADAEQAIGADGRVRDNISLPRLNDELGDLRRSFAHVLGELKAHTDYLRTLADKLSHELRTPLAMVQSSLDNLEPEQMNAAARNYAHRAREGTARLRQILQAMSEAKRLEYSIRDADLESFDLAAIVKTGVENWQRLRGDLNLRIIVPKAPQMFYGAPELILRLLDKLLENAADFVREDGLIEVELFKHDDQFLLRVGNEGPPLPAAHGSQLFESLVSLRASRGKTPHLGLGLYIARLITDFHNGSIRALNIKNGARFEVTLPDPRSSGRKK